MKITEVKLNALINIGPYSHVTMDAVATLGEGEDCLIVLSQWKERAIDILNGVSFVTETTPTTSKFVEAAPVPNTLTEIKTYFQADGTVSEVPGEIPPPIPKEAAKRTRTAKPKVETVVDDTEWEDVASPYVEPVKASIKVKSEEPLEVQASKTEVVAKVKKAVDAPHIKYDKGIVEHRSTLASLLGAAHPTWKTSKSKDDIATMSNSLVGKPFMDLQGNITNEFKAEVAKFF